MRIAALPVIPLLGDGQQRLQPVHISDVVASLITALTHQTSRLTLDIVGPQKITLADWLQILRNVQGRPTARLLKLPFALALAASYLGRHLNPIVQPDNLRMLRAGYQAEVAPLERFLGRAPRAWSKQLILSDARLAEIADPST